VSCPKCGAEVKKSDLECRHCGIIFAKYLRREDEPLPRTVPIEELDAEDDQPLTTLFVGVDKAASMPIAIGRGVFLFLLAIWTTKLASLAVSAAAAGSFMHLPDLVFHEAGHILFNPFGRFMMVLGGSLTQVLVPLVCAGAFLWQTRDPFGAAVATWWAGQSLTDLAPYVNDARDLQLVLLGGKTGAEVEGHDWEYLLNAMGVSHLDHAIARVVQTIGTLTMILALVWAAIVVLNQVSVLRGRQPRRA
jgi:hypothetical protein